jgi:hypothetical protein
VAGNGRSLPDQLHAGTGDLRGDSEDVRGPRAMRRQRSWPERPLRRARRRGPS